MIEYRIGPSQLLRCAERLTSEEEGLLKSYLNGNYTVIRQKIGVTTSNERKIIDNIFLYKALRSRDEMVVYRSQSHLFNTVNATNSIISTVRERAYSDRFGMLIYAFLVAPHVPYIEIEWNLGKNNGTFTEVILPPKGHFRKSTTKKFPTVDDVYSFDMKPSTPSPKSSPKVQKHTTMEEYHMMSLRNLDVFRDLPKRKQTKRALLDILGYEDASELELAGNTLEKNAYNNALSRSLSS